MHSVDICHRTSLPMREISALALHGDVNGRRRLLAVGDEEFTVVSAELEGGIEPGHTQRHNLCPALTERGIDVDSGSGFEGVAADGEGTVLLLQEEDSRLLVMAPDLSRLVQVLVLDVPVDHPEIGTAW